MADPIGSLARHAAAAACLCLALVCPAFAQGAGTQGGTTQVDDAPAGPSFMSRYDFHLGAAALATDDRRFKWDTHFGGDVDVVDYVRGRVRVVADYQALLGSEFRPFDPNQGNYVLEASASARTHGYEIAGVFHHESRHLSDRPKRFSIDWNALGGRVLRRLEIRGTTIEVEAGIGAVIKHSYTDYKWVADGDLLLRHPVGPHAAPFARATFVLYGVDGAVPRDNQKGARVEVGLRLTGRAGAVELFAGAERMVDAYPVDRIPHGWPFAGFRLVSR